MNDCTFIILGASGDLSKRKLLPALYALFAKKKINKFIIVGAARDTRDTTAILDSVRTGMDAVDATIFEQFSKHFFVCPVDFNNKSDFIALQSHVTELEQRFSLSGNRLIYCATASQFYCQITQALAESALAVRISEGDKRWYRIVYEKPFGQNAQSAQEINECIRRYFDEVQIYRIDHYLTKELVSNIALLRFTNCVFEPLWNNNYIEEVQIILDEQLGLEGRGSYYDAYGALCDVVQNHMLELLALIAMESPEWLSGDYIRTQRARVLESVRIVDGFLGQFEGYMQEPGVRSNSTTETFAVVRLAVDNARWAGVPFYLRTGKSLDKKETAIHIKFKAVQCLLTKHCPSEKNSLTIQIWPQGIFSLRINAKKFGYSEEVVPINMDFCHGCVFGTETSQAHEVLFEEILRSEQSIAVRFDEIESLWRIIDSIKSMNFPLYTYAQGSRGPRESEEFAQKHHIRWLS